MQYAITDLGTLGGTYSEAYGINNCGQVVGAADSSGYQHAFLWQSGSGMKDLGTLGGTESCALGINTSGQVVGFATISGDTSYHPFLYNGSGSMQDLGTLNGSSDDFACGINNSGQIVGGPEVDMPNWSISGTGHAFLYTGTGPMQDLGSLEGYPWSSAHSINDSGQIVGLAPYYEYHAFLYSGGTMQYLGKLLDVPGTGSNAKAINNVGEIVGWSNADGGWAHAFKYTGSGPMQDLGTLGGDSSEACAVNNSGQIVGCSTDGKDGNWHAFISTGSGPMQDLGGLIAPSSAWTLYVATAINDKGQIVGYGTNPAGQTHAFLLTPETLPEKAAELAKQVIGAPYLGDGETWGGKGYDYHLHHFIEPDKVKTTGYWYWNNNTCVIKSTNECHSCAAGNCEIGTNGTIGLDCSGLIYWSYNRAYFQSNPPGITSRPFAYEGVSGQRSNYSINAPVSESDLHAGDLLFTEGHVMMYTGPFTYEGKTYNVVHASYCRKQVVPATYDFATKKVITEGCPDINITGYGRWREQTVDAIYTKCLIDLVVTDPDGFTVSKDTPEIPGLLYFSVYDVDENGKPDEMVTIPKRKVGTYLITVIPESNALPTDTYSLETTIDGQTIVLAKDVQIQNIPPQPYEVKSRLNPADFDDDGDVDFVDYAVFANYWMNQNCAEPNWCSGADLNKNGSVDLYDLAEFAEYWLEGTSP
ncbi:MAG: NlpC/P60 family protein [Sedimentisphaerales bacterium]